MFKTIRASAFPAMLAAIIVAATWLPTLGADFRPLTNPFAEQAFQA